MARDPGPFVQFVAACLKLVGAFNEDKAVAGAARLINEWERRRKGSKSDTQKAKKKGGSTARPKTFLKE